MIPYIFIIVGTAATVYGLIMLIRMAFLPIIRAHQVVFRREDDYLYYESAKGQKVLRSQIRFLLNIYITLVVVGSLLVIIGFYAGFTQHGPQFWLYKTLFQSEKTSDNDIINEKGQYVASDNQTYNHYIIIEGAKIYYKNELCESAELEKRIKEHDRTNPIVIHDNFAVSSTYHYVIDMLTEYAIQYIEERN